MSALQSVLTAETIERWAVAPSTSELQDRLSIARAPDVFPDDPDERLPLLFDHARRVAWELYLDTANAIGLLDSDLIERLRSRDDDAFRPAMAECMTASYLVDDLRLNVCARPPGRDRRKLEMAIQDTHGMIGVEVKSPRMPDGPMEAGPVPSERDEYETVLRTANRQFPSSGRNLLVVVPRRSSMFTTLEYGMMRALIGEHVIAFDIDRQNGGKIGESRSEFRTNGRLTRAPQGQLPHYQSVSAVLCLEEISRTRFTSPGDLALQAFNGRHFTDAEVQEAFDRFYSDKNVARIEHSVVVVHNPYARGAIDPAVFGDARQLVVKPGGMTWIGQRPYG